MKLWWYGICRAVAAALAVIVTISAASAADRVLVFTAASMSEVMSELADRYRRETGNEAVLSLAGSGALARQIEAGAPADAYISANTAWVDWLDQRELLKAQSVTQIAGNRLVVAVPHFSEDWVDLESLVTQRRFAMGDPLSVPAGIYARQALTSLNLWQVAQRQAVFGENVRIALKRVGHREVSAAIVYSTDAAADPDVRAVYTFDEDLHDPITYWAAATAQSGEGADRFLAYLTSPSAIAIFARYGFGPVSNAGD
ncbi:MAG: molybdate ABC transporter substrate-binding protein [Ahrensia sp.]|nr:molybdate ABC transporter substrate-binding protein [Ahrensia sp.]